MIVTTEWYEIRGRDAGSPLNSKLSWSKTAGTASDRQDQENCAILRGRLNQTDLLYIFFFYFFILSTQESSKYTTIDVSSRLCIFRYLFYYPCRLYRYNSSLVHLFCFLFISHSCFIKKNNNTQSQFWEQLQNCTQSLLRQL